MRIRTNYMRVHESGSIAGSAVRHGPGECRIRCDRIGAIEFFEMEIWETRYQPRNISSRGLHFDRNRDGVSVVLHHEQHWQLAIGGGVQRLPELALAGGAVAE